jgi:hypothetical protein
VVRLPGLPRGAGTRRRGEAEAAMNQGYDQRHTIWCWIRREALYQICVRDFPHMKKWTRKKWLRELRKKLRQLDAMEDTCLPN